MTKKEKIIKILTDSHRMRWMPRMPAESFANAILQALNEPEEQQIEEIEQLNHKEFWKLSKANQEYRIVNVFQDLIKKSNEHTRAINKLTPQGG